MREMMPPLLLASIGACKECQQQQQFARVFAVAHVVYGQVYRRATAVES
jgi:hypothetical protein